MCSDRTLVSGTCSLVEGEMGIICACGPAIRQFVAYIHRTGTAFPSNARQHPNEDFVKMRRRINLRDLVWYQAPKLIAGRVLDAFPVRTQRSKEDVEATVRRSMLDSLSSKISGTMFGGNSAGNRSMSSKSDLATSTVSQQERLCIGKKHRGWGYLKKDSTGSSTTTHPPLL